MTTKSITPGDEAHGNTEQLRGNKNAKKDKTLAAQLVTRCTTEQKNAFVYQAKSEGKKLSQWIIDTLEKEISTKG